MTGYSSISKRDSNRKKNKGRGSKHRKPRHIRENRKKAREGRSSYKYLGCRDR